MGMVNGRNVHHLHSHVRQLLLYRLVPFGPKGTHLPGCIVRYRRVEMSELRIKLVRSMPLSTGCKTQKWSGAATKA
jgi:hypothetical protein